MNDMLNTNEILEFYVTEVNDISTVQIVSLTKGIREAETIRCMEALENARRCFMKIKRNGYTIADFGKHIIDNGRYNIRDFLQEICSGVNLYLSSVFDVDIEYKIYEEDNVNIDFDARLVEKAMYDSIFGLMCEMGINKQKVSVYAKDLSKHIKICMRCDGERKFKQEFFERNVLFAGYGESETASYAELTMKRIGGKYKCIYGRNDCKIELHIPKNLKVNQLRLNESEDKIVLGERVQVHRRCEREEIERFFGVFKVR